MNADPIADYLRRRRAAAHLVNAGLDGLLDRWKRTVDEVSEGYDAGLDDFLNDLDLRELLHELEREVPEAWTDAARDRLRAIDRRYRELVVPRRECLWGGGAARKHGWTARSNWWYFRAPREPGAELARDLERWAPR
jgi:hypothetical protein